VYNRPSRESLRAFSDSTWPTFAFQHVDGNGIAHNPLSFFLLKLLLTPKRLGSASINIGGDCSMARVIIDSCSFYTTTGIFTTQKRLTGVGKPTASVQRSQLIVALTEAVGQPPRLID
jgi:hypothetical protein